MWCVVMLRIAVIVTVFDDNGMGGRDAAAVDPVGGESPAVDTEAGDDVGHLHCVGTGVDECAHQHVTSNTGRAVDPGGLHGCRLSYAD
jgi:hypothetical protein